MPLCEKVNIVLCLSSCAVRLRTYAYILAYGISPQFSAEFWWWSIGSRLNVGHPTHHTLTASISTAWTISRPTCHVCVEALRWAAGPLTDDAATS